MPAWQKRGDSPCRGSWEHPARSAPHLWCDGSDLGHSAIPIQLAILVPNRKKAQSSVRPESRGTRSRPQIRLVTHSGPDLELPTRCGSSASLIKL